MDDLEKGVDTEDFEPEIVELDGEKFEIIDAMELEGVNYFALIPYSDGDDDDDEDTEFIILREIEEGGEYFLATIDDDETADKVGELFLAHFDELFSELEE
ncbi:MAG: DUF1292 domain-containing protein [Oscillospiraceae bacterium]|nr:DUF1292 domain-containing protein [Oscillospiraceae bacterium]